MPMCRRCLKNGRKIDGGEIGVCKQHARTRCHVCGAASLGEELCSAHTHQAELARWMAESQLRVVDPEDELDLEEIRHAKLMEAKFMAHKAVEVFFRSMLLAVTAIWGQPTRDQGPPAAEAKRKAA